MSATTRPRTPATERHLPHPGTSSQLVAHPSDMHPSHVLAPDRHGPNGARCLACGIITTSPALRRLARCRDAGRNVFGIIQVTQALERRGVDA